MASLANQTISSSYDGLIKTSSDNAVGVSGVQLLQDGSGNDLALSLGRTGQGVTVTGSLNATLATAAQPNITSVGTLSSLAVSGNAVLSSSLDVSNTITAGAVGVSDGSFVIKRASDGAAVSEFSIEPSDNATNLSTLYANLLFGTAGSEKMRIDSSGNVGIGTAPNRLLHLYGGAASTTWLLMNNSATGSAATDGFSIAQTGVDVSFINREAGYIDFQTSDVPRMRIDSSGNVIIYDGGLFVDSGADSQYGIFDSDNANGGYMTFKKSGTDIADIGNAAQIISGGSATDFGINVRPSNNLVFGTSNSERMRITSGGGVTIGDSSTTNTGKTEFDTGVGAYSGSVNVRHSTTNVDGSGYINFYRDTSVIGSINQVGTTSVAYNTSSDYRLKENVVPMEGALDRVDALKPSRFNFIADADKTVDGFLAHEVAEVIPEAVTGEKDAVDEEGNPIYQGIDQSKIVPLLVGAIKELKAEIETLKSQING